MATITTDPTQSKKLKAYLTHLKGKIDSYKNTEKHELLILGSAKTVCPKYKMDDAEQEVTPPLRKVHMPPNLQYMEVENVLEDDGKVYNIRVTLFDKNGGYLSVPRVEYSEPIKNPTWAIKMDRARRYVSAWEEHCGHVHRRVDLINELRKASYEYAKRARPETLTMSLGDYLEPGDDHYKVVVEKYSDTNEPDTQYPNKRRRLLRPRDDNAVIKCLEAKLEVTKIQVEKLRGVQRALVEENHRVATNAKENVEKLKNAKEMTDSQLLLATKQLSDSCQKIERIEEEKVNLASKLVKTTEANVALSAQLEKLDLEKRTFQDRFRKLGEELGHVKEEHVTA